MTQAAKQTQYVIVRPNALRPHRLMVLQDNGAFERGPWARPKVMGHDRAQTEINDYRALGGKVITIDELEAANEEW